MPIPFHGLAETGVNKTTRLFFLAGGTYVHNSVDVVGDRIRPQRIGVRVRCEVDHRVHLIEVADPPWVSGCTPSHRADTDGARLPDAAGRRTPGRRPFTAGSGSPPTGGGTTGRW